MKKLILLPLLFLSFAQAETFGCKVIDVNDGDTITCLTDQKEQITVRLYQIDAPESGQAYGQKAKQALSDMAFNDNVTIEAHKKDLYERILGTVYFHPKCPILRTCSSEFYSKTNIVDVNLELIKQGYAWHYPFDKTNPEYIQAEQEARKAKRGLWADKNPIAPWEWRKEKKSKE